MGYANAGSCGRGKVLREIKPEEAKSLVDILGPHINPTCDFTHYPEYPATRKDICAIKRVAENGHSYGYDTIYFLWQTQEGKIKHKELTNTSSTKANLFIKEIIETDEHVLVKIRYSSFTEINENRILEYPIKKQELGL